jgi:pimeloyl-CoA synthetase
VLPKPVVKVSASILDTKTGETLTVTKEGGTRTKVLLSFMWDARKYADKNHKILRLTTDDMTVYSELKQHYPTLNVELLEETESSSIPAGAD